jgi:tRNA(Ser,Leu) C12 N-acetylase TAN1
LVEGKVEDVPTDLRKILEEFVNVFQVKNELPPDWKEYNFRIKLVAGARSQVRRHERLSEKEVEEMKKRIKELLEMGHIEPSTSL